MPATRVKPIKLRLQLPARRYLTQRKQLRQQQGKICDLGHSALKGLEKQLKCRLINVSKDGVMRLFSPLKPSTIILPSERELEEENERLRKLAVTLKEKVDALRNGLN